MAHKMWGGRFNQDPNKMMEDINASIDFDQRLVHQDIVGSRIHCKMLSDTGIISSKDAQSILSGLDIIEEEIKKGDFTFSRRLEDIHMNIEARLSDLIGSTAGRLHTARSRNDQVATDFKLYIRDILEKFDKQLAELQYVLVKSAYMHTDTIMPGFTHLQIAQPVTYGHHLLAYVEMFSRDRGRFLDAHKRMNENPLGAVALAGTAFPIDRHQTSRLLGFDKPTPNSIDSVSDRDFVLEALSCASMTIMHLSRLAEEIVIFSSAQFGFFKLSDDFSTGSSIMPQKRNPDAAELIRAKTGHIMGSFMALLMVMKGLPLAYSKDMQEDKKGSFEAFDNLSLCIVTMTMMMSCLEIDKEKMRESAEIGFSTATDLADWLVREAGLPFREAHQVTGILVAQAEKKGLTLGQMSLSSMQSVEDRITEDIYTILTVDSSVASRTSYGGTAPDNVKKEAEIWLERLEDERG